jgi:aromatic-amino-acid transaminase
MFQHVCAYAGDPILTLNEEFVADPRPDKVNLSIGVYLDDQRRLPRFQAVAAAEDALRKQRSPYPYLPMEGSKEYRAQTQRLVFGDLDGPARSDQVATVQTLGGSGALRVGADFLHAWFPHARVWTSSPTWDNHMGIFKGAGFQVASYPYYSAETKRVDFDAMLATIKSLPAGDIVVLHACCHNPTGADLNESQWRELAMVFRERSLLPFFDIAYQGFGTDLEQDVFAIRHFAQSGIALLVAASFSKNFSLYGERCGALHAVCGDAAQASIVLGQLKSTVRTNYSSPPGFGSRIVTAVLADPDLRTLWRDELASMRTRMAAMRAGLRAQLLARCPHGDFDYLTRQSGMFSFTGLMPQQVRLLREDHAVYLIDSGRMCVAALTQQTLEPVAEAMAQVLAQIRGRS